MGLYMDQAMDLSSVSLSNLDESKLQSKQLQQQNIQQQQQQHRDQENLKELSDRLKSVLSCGSNEMGMATPPVEVTVQHTQVLSDAAHLAGQDATRSTASTMNQQQLQQHIFQHARTSSPSNSLSRRNSIDLKEKPAARLSQFQPQLNSSASASSVAGQTQSGAVDCPDFDPSSKQLISKFQQSLNSNMISNELNLAAMYNSYQNMMNTYNATLNNTPYASIASLLVQQQQQRQQPGQQQQQQQSSQSSLNGQMSQQQQQLSQANIANQIQLQQNQLNQQQQQSIYQQQQQQSQFENQLNMQTLTFLQDLFQK